MGNDASDVLPRAHAMTERATQAGGGSDDWQAPRDEHDHAVSAWRLRSFGGHEISEEQLATLWWTDRSGGWRCGGCVEQLQHLVRLGCDRGQGFLWSPAVEPTSAEAMLHDAFYLPQSDLKPEAVALIV